MYIVNEEDKEYRFGDSGPKYLMKAPLSDRKPPDHSLLNLLIAKSSLSLIHI